MDIIVTPMKLEVLCNQHDDIVLLGGNDHRKLLH
jgi:hypothetical protein